MLIKIRKSVKAQSILEYIYVSIAFATVGIATFMTALKASTMRRRGLTETYASADTDLGTTLDDGVDKKTRLWPSTWAEHNSDKTDNYDATISEAQFANPEGDQTGKSLGQYYEYEPLDWTVMELIDNESVGGEIIYD